MNLLNNINLNNNQILNAVLHKVSAIGDITTPVEGQLVYVISDGFYYRISSSWIKVPLTTDVITSLSSTNSSVTFTVTNDGNGFKTVSISIADATTSNSGFMSTTDKSKLDFSTHQSIAGTIIKRNETGNAQVETPVLSKDITNKEYVDLKFATVTSGGALTPPEVYDLTNSLTKVFPSSSIAGKTYMLTNTNIEGTILGTLNTVKVNNGDLLICVRGTASLPASTVNGTDWFVLESNRDSATDVIQGVVKLVKTPITHNDVLTSNNGESLSPVALENFTRKFKTSFVTTSSIEYNIFHDMNKSIKEIDIIIKDESGNEINVFKEEVDLRNIKLLLSSPVIINQTYYITIIG